MSKLVKLDIMSDGSVSLCGTRITPNKMYGIQTVQKSIAVSEKAIIKALEFDKAIRAKSVEELQNLKESKCKYWNAEHEDCALNCAEIRAKAIEEFAEQFCAACCENTFHATINGIKNVEMMTLDGVTETIFEVAEKMNGGAE